MFLLFRCAQEALFRKYNITLTLNSTENEPVTSESQNLEKPNLENLEHKIGR